MPLNYGLADVGMIGLRDVLLVAPASSFHTQHHPGHAAAAQLSPADHSVIPLLAAAPCLIDDSDAGAARGRVPTGTNLWQNQPAQQPSARVPENHNLITASPSYLGKPMPVPMPVFDSTSATSTAAGILRGGLGGSGVTAGLGSGGFGVGPASSATCQDCGNQAKKDCSQRRCRTCCKSRGFDCPTHVKSTWVSAARRRERQMSGGAAPTLVGGGGGHDAAAPASSASTSASKKPRLVASDSQAAATATAMTNTTASPTSTSNTTTPPRSLDTGSSHQDASFRGSLPGHVRAPAVFKCVRVTTVDDGEDEYAYQAMVSIGGHIFKGFLYDQGVEEPGSSTGSRYAPRRPSSDAVHDDLDGKRNSSGSMPNISELHLGGAAVGGGPTSDAHATACTAGGGLMMGGTAYGNPIN